MRVSTPWVRVSMIIFTLPTKALEVIFSKLNFMEVTEHNFYSEKIFVALFVHEKLLNYLDAKHEPQLKLLLGFSLTPFTYFELSYNKKSIGQHRFS